MEIPTSDKGVSCPGRDSVTPTNNGQDDKKEVLIRITSTYFCAGVVLIDNMVWYATPILRYMIYWDLEKITFYVKKKNWNLEIL